MIVGDWAYNRHVEPRVTGDIDFFVENSPASERLIRQLLKDFGFGSVLPSGPLFNEDVITLGRAPHRIDLLTKIDGLTFADAWNSREYEVTDGLRVPYIFRALLLKNEQSTGRAKDQLDLVALTRNAADHESS